MASRSCRAREKRVHASAKAASRPPQSKVMAPLRWDNASRRHYERTRGRPGIATIIWARTNTECAGNDGALAWGGAFMREPKRRHGRRSPK